MLCLKETYWFFYSYVKQRYELRHFNKRNVSMTFVMKYIWPVFHAYIPNI
jgi:hypothetical protein